jgi:hypothetical protein
LEENIGDIHAITYRIPNNPKSISLEIDGVIYESKTEAMKKLNLSRWKLNKLLKEK